MRHADAIELARAYRALHDALHDWLVHEWSWSATTGDGEIELSTGAEDSEFVRPYRIAYNAARERVAAAERKLADSIEDIEPMLRTVPEHAFKRTVGKRSGVVLTRDPGVPA